MSIQVHDFQWEPGKNDAEYIKLLESSRDDWKRTAQKAISKLKTLSKEQKPITGDTSDGYHTFNELYHHRAVLFSVIVANYSDKAWKSKKHHDDTMYDGMFIVGIDTPDGQATYHYDIDPYWNMFKCRVLDRAPEWDDHTPAQAIERIGKLKPQEPVKPVPDTSYGARPWWFVCGNCKLSINEDQKYCPNCGKKVKWE